MSDYLDDLIEMNVSADPEFRAAWKEAEVRINLAMLRKRANMTQEDVAKKMGVSRPRVAELERRPLSVSFRRMLAYAEALGVPIEQIAKEVRQAA